MIIRLKLFFLVSFILILVSSQSMASNLKFIDAFKQRFHSPPDSMKYAITKELTKQLKFYDVYEVLSLAKKNLEMLRQIGYEHYIQFKTLMDSIFNTEKSKQFQGNQTKYNQKAKDEENLLLRIQDIENQRNIKLGNSIVIILSIVTLISVVLVILLFRINKRHKELNLKLSAHGKELIELNRRKDSFFSFVVHNLKNPLNTIFGFSELMQKHAKQKNIDQVLRYSKYIYDSSTSVKQILGNLHEWSRLQHGNYSYTPVKIELESLFKDTLELNENAAAKKKIILAYENIENKYAFADRQMVYTILQNLISNAIKYTPQSGEVLVSANYSGFFVEISVTDTGIGLSKKEIEQLFQFNLSTSKNISEVPKGSRMGLMICKEMVIKNGGELRVESKSGRGNKFIFTLPLPDSELQLTIMKETGTIEILHEIKQDLKKNEKFPVEFVEQINQSLLPLYDQVCKAITVEDLMNLSGSIISLANKYRVKPVKIYGDKLLKHTEALQFDIILKILPEFSELVKIINQN